MLTQADYIVLWTNTMGMPIQNIPCYYQYLQREVYFQDYLDLFCCPPNGKPTHERVLVGNHQTILLPPHINPNPSYTVRVNNVERLIVDYDYPFPNELCKQRLIKYILIGEAAPAAFIPRIERGLDCDNSYVYNVIHKKSTSYYKAPLKAWGISGKSKAEELIALANEGVILLDLFPFAHAYSTELRESLNQRRITDTFWIQMNYKVTAMENKGCLHSVWDFCFVAPETPSAHIIGTYADLSGKSMVAMHDLAHAPDFSVKKKKNKNPQVFGNYTATPLHHYPCSLGHLSKRAKLTTHIGGFGPHWELIKRAFDLP